MDVEQDLSPLKILLVDDEPSVLNALRRALHSLRCEIVVASSADEGLQILEQQPIDLVMSDMRMPGESGAWLLGEVAQRWPDTERILLTGYSDLELTIDAINKGKVNYYLEKPWDDERLLRVVNKGLSLARIRQRNNQLEQLNRQQNTQLEELNQQLQQKVEERTAELRAAVGELRTHYKSTIQTLGRLIEQRLAGHKSETDTVVWMADKMSGQLGLDEQQALVLRYAATLRDVGKVGMRDELLTTPYANMTDEARSEFERHPLFARMYLMDVAALRNTADVLALRKEYLDGSGYPIGVVGDQVKPLARVLTAICDFFELCHGQLEATALSPQQALERLQEDAGKRYDETVIDQLSLLVPELVSRLEDKGEACLAAHALRDGMRLTRDLVAPDGTLLLVKDRVLTETQIDRLREMENHFEESLHVYVEPLPATEEEAVTELDESEIDVSS